MDFLGRGWSFPVTVDKASEKICLSENEKDIEESIIIILATSKGERMMRPDFGCGIHNLMFSVINSATLSMAESMVRDALIMWEPRIEILSVKAKTEKIDLGTLLIDIEYKVRSTNNRFNLVYPYYLGV